MNDKNDLYGTDEIHSAVFRNTLYAFITMLDHDESVVEKIIRNDLIDGRALHPVFLYEYSAAYDTDERTECFFLHFGILYCRRRKHHLENKAPRT